MTELHYMAAADALAAFRKRELSPVELIEAVIARAEAVEDTLNAFTYTYYDQALRAARRSEQRYIEGTARPLEGLPVAIKDEAYIKGLPTSNGSLLMQENLADSTSPTAERVLGAGAICHARTATPEFSCAAFTWSRLWGVTRNPWNPDFTPGGSSGGSAAALAAGTTTLATGSDIGGSIRIPSSCCGLVGFKPPYGRNPDDPPFNMDFFNHSGPMARGVLDCILLQNVMSGPHPDDLASLKPKLDLPHRYRKVEGMRIAYSRDLGAFAVHPDVVNNTEDALALLADEGAEIEEVDLSWGPEVLRAGTEYLAHLFGGWIAETAHGQEDYLTSYAKGFVRASRQTSAMSIVNAFEVTGAMYRELSAILARCDVLVCPTNAVPAVAADFDPTRDAVVIEGIPVDPVLGWVLTVPFNMLSRCPVLSVPTGFGASGVPTGMQIVGRTYEDADVFRVAAAYEKVAGPWYGEGAARQPMIGQGDAQPLPSRPMSAR